MNADDSAVLPLDTARLDEIEARANAATPGPWRSMREGNQRYGDSEQFFCGASRVDGLPRAYNTQYVIPAIHLEHVSRFKDEDADFIAHARDDVPALIAEVRRLRSAEQSEDAPMERRLTDRPDMGVCEHGTDRSTDWCVICDRDLFPTVECCPRCKYPLWMHPCET